MMKGKYGNVGQQVNKMDSPTKVGKGKKEQRMEKKDVRIGGREMHQQHIKAKPESKSEWEEKKGSTHCATEKRNNLNKAETKQNLVNVHFINSIPLS